MLPTDEYGFTPEHVADFQKRGLTAQQAYEGGARAVFTHDDLPEGCPHYWTNEIHAADDENPVEWAYLPGRVYKMASPDGDTIEYQLKPDRPQINPGNGRPKKYVFRKGAASVLHTARVVDETGPMVVIEGTHQPLVGAVFAPVEFSVFGIAGAQSWFKHGLPTNDLWVASGREVLVCLDADANSNDKVYNAGLKLGANLDVCGATSVRFIRLSDLTGGTNGLDDYLGNLPVMRRSQAFEGLVGRTRAMKPIDKPHLPARKIPPTTAASDDEPSDPDSIFTDKGKLRTKTASRVVRETFPCLLTGRMDIAVYRGGAYRIDKMAFRAACSRLLGERATPTYRSAIEEYTGGELYLDDQYLPNTIDLPLMNTLDGMVDLRTGELLPHDPAYLSNVQFPIHWNPDAKCPNYEKWIKDRCGDQVDALEELVSTMLDPTGTPQQIIFLYGDGGTGKGTFLRLMQGVVGQENYSSETLHELIDGQFSAAELYGKVLNANGDLSAVPVGDPSILKMLTGDDAIPANKKWGDKFNFISRALLAFALNTIMSISEDSNAIMRRSRPFRFGNSFAGAEDKNIEKILMQELDGILARWVRAWRRRFVERGGRELAPDPLVMLDFEMRVDKVRKFAVHCLEVIETDGSTTDKGATQTQLYQAYQRFNDDEGSRALQQSRFVDRLSRMDGVREVRFGTKRVRGFNVRIRPEDEWGADLPQSVHTPRSEGRADRADIEKEFSIGVEKVYPQDHLEDVSRPPKRVDGPADPPDLPAPSQRPVFEPHSGSDLIDQLLLGAHHDPAPCDTCATDLVLVEPHRAWYACPQCHPATTRHSERINLS